MIRLEGHIFSTEEKTLKKLGFKFKNDPDKRMTFVEEFNIPTGWKFEKMPGPLSDSILVLDKSGRERVFIKKGIEYIRFECLTRLYIQFCICVQPPEHPDTICEFQVIDRGKSKAIIFTTNRFGYRTKAESKAMEKAINWLDTHRPNWRDPNAYWDDD